jgi:Fe-S cluster biogenesis protein NfuA
VKSKWQPHKSGRGGLSAEPIAAAQVAILNSLRSTHFSTNEFVPYLAGDGGWLEVLELADNQLSIRYEGACGSCPSSLSGTLMAIENMIKRRSTRDLRYRRLGNLLCVLSLTWHAKAVLSHAKTAKNRQDEIQYFLTLPRFIRHN